MNSNEQTMYCVSTLGQPEGFENQSGRQIYRQPPQQYLQGFHQSGVPPHDMSKQSMSAQVPPPPGQTPPQATGVQMMYPNVTQQVPRNAVSSGLSWLHGPVL